MKGSGFVQITMDPDPCTGTSVSWPVLSFPSPERWSQPQPLLPCLASVTEEPASSSSSSHPLEDNSSLPMTEDGYLGNYGYSCQSRYRIRRRHPRKNPDPDPVGFFIIFFLPPPPTLWRTTARCPWPYSSGSLWDFKSFVTPIFSSFYFIC